MAWELWDGLRGLGQQRLRMDIPWEVEGSGVGRAEEKGFTLEGMGRAISGRGMIFRWPLTGIVMSRGAGKGMSWGLLPEGLLAIINMVILSMPGAVHASCSWTLMFAISPAQINYH